MGQPEVLKSPGFCGRHGVLPHELLREHFVRFQPGGRGVRAEYAQPGLFEGISHPQCERLFRPDDGQADRLPPRDFDGQRDVARVARDVGAQSRGACVAGQDEELAEFARAGQSAAERVLPTAGADDEYVHGLPCDGSRG